MRIESFALHPDGKRVALAVSDEKTGKGGIAIRLVHDSNASNDSKLKFDATTEYAPPPTMLAYSTDGKLLLVGRENNLFNIWDPARHKPGPGAPQSFSAPAHGKAHAAVGIDANQFVVALDAQLWLCDNIGGDSEKKTKIYGHEKANADPDKNPPITLLAVAPGGRELVWAAGHLVFHFDLKSNRMLREFAEHDRPVTAIALDRTGRWLASADDAGKIYVRTLE